MVFVLDKHKKPLLPTSNAKARKLLKSGKAVIHKYYPFTIRLKYEISNPRSDKQFTIKIDPGAMYTGLAVVDDNNVAYFFAEIEHRGHIVKKLMDKRRAVRRSRRNRKTRYRKPRFDNRRKPEGWLPPSVKSRADNIVNWVKKLSKLLPINRVMIEDVSFDTASMTAGKQLYGDQYQKGPLYNTELRDYLLKKFNYTCVYCGGSSGDAQLEIDHVIPRSRGGTNALSNLVIACHSCNQKKSNLTLKEFGKLMNKDFSHLKVGQQLRAAAIVQSAKNYVVNQLQDAGFQVERHEAWKTALNRKQLQLPKTHYYDALCVGEIANYKLANNDIGVLKIKATGRGTRQVCRVDRYGFPRGCKKCNSFAGIRTGDLVTANVTRGKFKGKYVGRVSIGCRGKFIMHANGKRYDGIMAKYVTRILQRNDGYMYHFENAA